ncbi:MULTISPECIES: response regulator transcription factor [unclassified Pseudomonas]|uniref:response regulator n=1 Tax=unclassified Pseudomonas TaxID=196821 RepID=UPI00119B1FB4|nr:MULTISPECIES: response regulator transcription factor [unclassified Pseudomonas]TWC18452.1 LuxR family two component transcriptional regulator [Pseudomonas sp. SJZ075]TWC23456.1 LuxR family two component transcriptional regulator [Pseudomonas sp. SJZ074]TWC34777.1 LuxR family two component transcriptional regulator [Pseudomonas sp. SJZ078]TWC40596.1 LuxR family two component transcriptional regulator [Pseudomonas sp. SJZ085]TWC55477.1 LuxR family two component transcriptional regulator [Pse
MIRLMITDDHAIMREGLKQLFALAPDVRVVAEAENGAMLLEQLRVTEIDLLLLDMSMPGICGDDLVARIRFHYPKLPILVLSMHNEVQIAQRAFRSGASGYLTKDRDPETLLAAIRRVAAGGRYIDAGLAEQMAFAASGLGPLSQHDGLTDRELQVMRQLAQGLSVSRIAAELAISHKTVSTHKARLMEKMGFTSTADIVRYAIKHGVL